MEESELAIRADLASTPATLPDGLTLRSMNLGNRTLRYSAFKLPDGAIHVGRITVR